MGNRKLNPLFLATDKFQLQKMRPVVDDHLLSSDRKRIITSLRGRRTDMAFRLGREYRSSIGSWRNNFLPCLSFTFKSRARFVREDWEMTVWWSALSQGCSCCKYGIAASISSSAGKKRQENLGNAFKFHLPSSTVLPRADWGHSFMFSSVQGPTCVQAEAKSPVYKLSERVFSVFRQASKPLKIIQTFSSSSRFPLEESWCVV